MKNKLDVDYLKELFDYDKKEGELYWKQSRGRVKAGDEAGGLHKLGYVCVSIDGVSYGVHRIIWALENNTYPNLLIDHINGIRNDNRIENLRHASPQTNIQNRSIVTAKKKIQYLGVRQNKGCKTFSATININGKTRWLGSFKTAELAHDAYMEAKRKYHVGNGAYKPMFETNAQAA